MNDPVNEAQLHALKVAFCYMPKARDVNQYDHGDQVEKILAHINLVREALLSAGVDPDEVPGEINPDAGGQSYY